jgi:hypothetical protein
MIGLVQRVAKSRCHERVLEWMPPGKKKEEMDKRGELEG